MNYQELKEFASDLNIERTEMPLNALKLAEGLNIPYGNEEVAKRDFKGEINPLYETPAFLKINKKTGDGK